MTPCTMTRSIAPWSSRISEQHWPLPLGRVIDWTFSGQFLHIYDQDSSSLPWVIFCWNGLEMPKRCRKRGQPAQVRRDKMWEEGPVPLGWGFILHLSVSKWPQWQSRVGSGGAVGDLWRTEVLGELGIGEGLTWTEAERRRPIQRMLTTNTI